MNMKGFAATAFKFIAKIASAAGALVALGWTAYAAFNGLLDAKLGTVEARITTVIDQRESKIMAVHDAEMKGLHGKIDTLTKMTETVIRQNYQTQKAVKSLDTP